MPVEENGNLIFTPEELGGIDQIDADAKDIEYVLTSEEIGKNKTLRRQMEAYITKKVNGKQAFLIKRLIDLADGVYVAEKIRGRTMRYYKQKPDLKAIELLLKLGFGHLSKDLDAPDEGKGMQTMAGMIKALAETSANIYARGRKDQKKEDSVIDG